MKVIIQNFRCFRKQIIYEFQDGKITLLKGSSGAGKSTLLEAIRWCLYGNLRNIYPSGFTPTPTNKTFVSLEINNLEITRSQAPEQLKLIINKESELISSAAQCYIDSQFGNKNVWLASSFIRQGERCPLMTASNQDRMTLLNEILFGNDNSSIYENPDYYTEKIEEEINNIAKQITGETAVFNASYTKYVNGINTYENKHGFSSMNSETITSYINEYNKLKSEVELNSQKLIRETTLEKQKELLNLRLSTMKEISPIDDNMIQQTKTKLDDIISKENNTRNELSTLLLRKSKFMALSAELETQRKRYKPEICSTTSTELKQHKINLQNDLTQSKNLYRTVQSDELQLESSNFKLNSLLNEQNSNDKTLSTYEYKNIETISTLLQYKLLQNKLNELEEKLKSLSDVKKVNVNIPLRRKEIESILLELRYGLNMCSKYSLTVNSLPEYIEQIKQIVEQHKIQKQHLNNAKLHSETQSSIDKLKASLILTSTQSIEELKSAIDTIRQRMGNPLKCPCCAKILELKNNTLIVPDNEIIDTSKGLQEIASLTQEINNIQSNKNIELQIVNLEQKLSLIEPFDETIIKSPIYDEAQIARCSNLISDFSKVNIELLQKYNATELENELSNLNLLEKYTTFENEKTTLLNQIDNLPKIQTTLSEEQLRQQLATLPLLLNKQNQILTDLNKINEQINIIKLRLNNLSSSSIKLQIEQNEASLISLETLYKEIEEQELILQRITALENEISSLSNNLNDELLELSLKNEIQSLERRKQELETLFQNQKQQLNEYKEYTKLHTELLSINIEKGSKYYMQQNEELNTQINLYESMHKSAKEFYTLQIQKEELEGLHKIVSDLTQKQAYLNYLKTLIIEVANNTLQSLVDNINNTTNTILEELFDNSMVVELKLYKELKAKQKIKPQVNITIYYNGNTYDNISSLSGGESERVSLALTLALATIHTSPIVFLDECMSALNSEIRTDCIETIQKFLTIENNKTIVNIEHSSIEGLYDDTVSI